ncbi:crotonase/enoyl-CoA hydratase family protein [Pseudahrensia aquimaris]|uniref:Crotonase/enoyl-CoA hydratase family protein n=1 Tax=Pseudahrensia aquimaris TaxID=744461 RepID=A0ABW3FCT5_9HYPH
MDAPNDDLLIERHGRVLVVSINRPHRRNAVDRATGDALYAAFNDFEADDGVDVAVLTGTEGAFCAGFDLISLAESGSSARVEDGGEGDLGPMGPTRMVLSKPVIAAIEGHAVAGGMELALWCDLRVMAADATFGIYCRRFGVPLVDGGTFRLARLIGESRAMDLVLTGRPVDAAEAERIGLANRVVPSGTALDAALALATSLTKFPQTCMRNDRLSMLQQWGMSHDEALRNEYRLGLETMDTGETLDGAKRFSGGEGRGGKF